MMKKKLKVLILDDDRGFLKILKEAFEKNNVEVILPEFSLNFADILSKIKKNNPTDILMDVNLGQFNAEFWLERLKKKIKLSKIRIWMVSGLEFINIQKFQSITPSVQTTWFGKPILDVNELITAFTGKKSFSLPNWLENMPLPVRVIDQEGRVIFCNDHWVSARNRPDPKQFIPFSPDKIPPMKEFWGPSPHKYMDYGSYNLHSFLFPENPELLAQMPQPQQDRGIHYDLETLIHEIFTTMKGAGFVRGRFYRIIEVPGSEGILELAYASPKINSDFPLKRPLDGAVLKKIKEYEEYERKPRGWLVKRIRKSSEENKNWDKELQFWNNFVDFSPLESWLEIPVFIEKEKKLKPSAWFVFDRLGLQGYFDGHENEVTESQVKMVESTLLWALKEISQVLPEEEEKKKLEIQKQFNDWDKKISPKKESSDVKGPARDFLQAAIYFSNSENGVLLTKDIHSNYLEICAAIGDPHQLILNNKVDLKNNSLPIVLCWERNNVIALPNLHLFDKENDYPQQSRIKTTLFSQKEQQQIWFNKEFKSMVAIPIRYDMEKVGVMALFSKKSHHFTEETIENLKTFSTHARGFLKAIQINESRKDWEGVFTHEIGTDIKVISEGVQHTLFSEPNTPINDPEIQDNLKKAQRRIQNLQDLINNFMEFNDRPSSELDLNTSFQARHKILVKILDIYGVYQEAREQRIEIVPTEDSLVWKCYLKGNQKLFSRTLRTLIDNAMKYGGKHAYIPISAKIEKEFWTLEITNPGQMSPEEDQLKFVHNQKPAERKKDGAHVGLAAAYRVVQAHGGNLELINIQPKGEERVKATLQWPIDSK